ncbi:MAG TPA: hypothetical protein DDZ39_12565 [Flavobacteriaceae bacterium]|nr:hypothetical protein [Flavobacteriaceae bacterium]HBS12441.1 hypothetical protein [Flavobacteriaceae bacterium]
MKKHKTLILFFSIIVFMSCNTDSDETEHSFKSIPKSEKIIKANNKFAFSIFKKIAKEEAEANYMISPVSASLALGMVHNGAKNETLNAFNHVFNYGDASLNEINTVNQSIINHLTENTLGSTFNIANSLWIDNNFQVKEDFIKRNKLFYNAEVQNIDFKNPNSVNIINDWVSDKTQEKIPTIIENIPSNMVMYAINALYFKSDWKYTFDPKNTTLKPFYINKNSTKEVEMMNMTQDLLYLKNDLFSSILLPYKNDKYNMVILLPNVDKSIKELVLVMNENHWSEWLNQYTKETVSLSMPKFSFSYKKMFNKALQNLGLEIAFTDQADFSGISNTATQISFVLQKTYIEVNEQGTEAAAVTAVGVGTTSIGLENIFTLNRPFLFLITEKTTQAVSFIGKVGSPK